jgi:hypothetical protein
MNYLRDRIRNQRGYWNVVVVVCSKLMKETGRRGRWLGWAEEDSLGYSFYFYVGRQDRVEGWGNHQIKGLVEEV